MKINELFCPFSSPCAIVMIMNSQTTFSTLGIITDADAVVAIVAEAEVDIR